MTGAGASSIETAFTGGDPRKLQNCDEVVALVLATPSRLGELFGCVFSDDEIVRFRASDALEKVCRRRPELLEPLVERLLLDMAGVHQASVQWHLAQILGEVTLSAGQRRRAVDLLIRNLEAWDDWIVVNLTLKTLAAFARDDPALRPDFVAILRRHQHSRHKSVASRVAKLFAEFTA